jgi:hypothetical protein
MQSCAPSLAQALLPYPQYCSNLQGANENQGKSSYNSLQVKVEKRFSHGTFFLVSYTLARTRMSGSDFVQTEADTWGGASGLISPYEQDRNDALAADDATHVSPRPSSGTPFGKGKKWVNQDGLANALLGGWQLSTSSATARPPVLLPVQLLQRAGQFRAGCIPSSTGDVFAQDKGASIRTRARSST